MAKKKVGRKKVKKFVEEGVVNIRATFNNTIVSVSDTNGNVLVLVQWWC